MNDLRALRERAGLTVREVAARAGTSHSTVVAYETGRKVPRADTRDRLIRAMGFVERPLLCPRRIAFNARGTPRGQELLDVLELTDVLMQSVSRASSLPGRPPDLEAPVFPERRRP